MSSNIWADPARFVRAPSQAAAVLRQFDLPRVDRYLAALSESGGIDLHELRRLSENTLLAQTGEDHLTMRRIIARFFSRAGLEPWKPVINQAVETALARLARAKSPDLVADFTNVLFLETLPRLLGLKVESPRTFFEAVETVQRLTEPYLSVAELKALNRDVGILVRSFPADAPVEGQAGMGEAEPQSLLAFLQSRRDELPAGMDPRYFVLGLLAGSNSATQSLAFALHGLLTGPPEAWQEPARPGWAEREVQRLLSLYQSTRTLVRAVDAPAEVAGCPYHPGQSVVVDIVGANACLRAESGHGSAHMSFGAGAHKCPGLFLSEMLFEAAIPALARRFPRLHLITERCRFVVTPMMQTPVTLPCETAPASRRLSARLVEIADMPLARRVLSADDSFAPPPMAQHLERLAERGGLDLDTAICVARNAMFFMEGPRHAALRDAVTRHLGQARLSAWTGAIDAAIGETLESLATMKTPDLVTGFADPIRQRAVAPILGIRAADPARFEAIAPGLQDILEPWLPLRELLRIQQSFAEALTQMRPPQDVTPGSSLLGALLCAPPEGFDEADLMAAVLVFYGASFNLTHTLANALHWILTRPIEERQDICQPHWIETRLEALIAACSGPKYIYRTARHALELAVPETSAGAGEATCPLAVGEGDTLRLSVHALNRQTRAGAGHLSFGQGLHRCIGAGLSRLILRRSVPALLNRFPGITLVAQGQRYFPMSQTVALRTLPCTFPKGSG